MGSVDANPEITLNGTAEDTTFYVDLIVYLNFLTSAVFYQKL